MVSDLTNLRFYCPTNLDLPAKLKEHGGEKWLGKDIWRLYYIITVIYRKRWESDFDRRDKHEFVELKAAILRKILSADKAKPALDILMKIGVLETDGHWRRRVLGRVRGKSKGYRFAEVYTENVKFREVKEIDYSKLPSKITDRSWYILALKPEHRHLFDSVIDTTLSARTVDVNREFVFRNLEEQGYYEQSIKDIVEKRWHFKVSDLTGRVFSNITNLPRIYRPCLLLRGKPLVEIDICSSQPLLLAALYDDGDSERERYLELVIKGEFYDVINSKLTVPYPPEQRDRLKEKVFTQILFDRTREKKSELLTIFLELFPHLYRKIVQIKTPDHCVLSHKLQRDEADIVVNRFVGEVIQTTKIPLLTVHDSVLVHPEYVDESVDMLSRAVFSKMGVRPKLKIKDYSNLNLTIHPSLL